MPTNVKKPSHLSGKTNDLIAFLVIQCALILPGIIASRAISVPQVFVPLSPASSKLGYTWSLALFLIPGLIFGIWTRWKIKDVKTWRAYGITVALLCPLGFILDLFFGHKFLTFEAKESVISSVWGDWWTLPAYEHPAGTGFTGWITGVIQRENWKRYIPIEEIIFYTLGFLAILMIYVWGSAVIFRRHKVDYRQHTPKIFNDFKHSIVSCLLIGTALCLIVVGLHKLSKNCGFPGYFLFLIICSVLPTMICFHVAYHFVNWRALTVSWLFLFVISQFWEASLGVPYQWWGYKMEQMLGWNIRAQCKLPVEAVLVWSLASWTSVIVFETVLAVIQLRHLKDTIGLMGGEKNTEQAGGLLDGKQSSALIAKLKEEYSKKGQSKQSIETEATPDTEPGS